MNELVKLTKQFHEKHKFSIGKSLLNCNNAKADEELSDAAETLQQLARRFELMMRTLNDVRIARAQLLIEELGELVQALLDKDEVTALDGIADLAFVDIGTAIAFGLPFEDALLEVCQSNLTKDPRDESDVRLRRKGINFVPPNMERVISRHRIKEINKYNKDS